MEIIKEISTLKVITRAAAARGQRIGLVPTMGALHQGHLSLVRRAREKADVVVASIFVNPTQFGPTEDYTRYPRNLERDATLLAQADVDYLFAPSVEEIYPPGYATYVEVEGLSDQLCGQSRPGHFRGVTTVVMKLLAIVAPHYAFFGQKDAQQVVIIKKMVEDLNLDVEIIVCPIVREADGLAMSSRNSYLHAEARQAAPVLYNALQRARQMIEAGTRSAPEIIQALRRLIESEPHTRIDYVEIVNARTLEPVATLSGECLIALAVFVGPTRLIDNLAVQCE
jgi:pantoate--beta-alanine ligase